MSKNNNSVEDILKSVDYIVELSPSNIDNQAGLKAVFPSNNLVFPSMQKIISYYFPNSNGFMYTTSYSDEQTEIQLPSYLIRPTIKLDINIMCQAIGYDFRYINGNIDAILPLELDSKQRVMEDYAYEIMKNNEGNVFPLSLGYFLKSRREEMRSSLI